MIKDPNVGWRRDAVVEYAKGKKVIDVGGALNHWFEPQPFCCLDILKGDCKLNFQGDVNMPLGWEEILEYVENHGKFDFAICTHVLEDVRNPPMILESLPLIAHEGFVSMPDKRTELQIQECNEPDTLERMGLKRAYRGYFHHRWIFTIRDEALWIFPKLTAIEVMKDLKWVEPRVTRELSFFWEGDIPYKMFQDDWLGPNPWEYIINYSREIKEGL